VLHVFFTPAAEEIAWVQERTASPESLFALVLALKCFQKMARFYSADKKECPIAAPVVSLRPAADVAAAARDAPGPQLRRVRRRFVHARSSGRVDG
jgi:hypothetical protein